MCVYVCVHVSVYLMVMYIFGFQIARTKCVIGDPSYFPDKVKKVGQVSSSTYTSTEHSDGMEEGPLVIIPLDSGANWQIKSLFT